MEFVAPKLTKSRNQKRQKRLIKNRRRNQRKKLEVKSSKRRKIARDNYNAPLVKQNENYCTMTANAFWENYKVAHDWQHRHNVAWWKSRCIALEHENRALRATIREQAATSTNNNQQTRNKNSQSHQNYCHIEEENDEYEDEEVEEENNAGNDEALEFHVDEEMMKFLEQSVRHKMELKRIRESENQESTDEQENEFKIESATSIVNNRIEDAKLLYGAASSRILAMETALQMSIDDYKDRAKPHYWPNIPLKL